MSATAHKGATVVEARELHAGDFVIFRDGREMSVDRVARRDGRVRVFFHGHPMVEVSQEYGVRVRAKHACDCGGTGRWVAGPIVNGKPSREGVHYPCSGKGWQSRADVIRNVTYWNKYARV